MRRSFLLAAVGTVLGAAGRVEAQAPVVGARDAEALFTSPDPKLHRNKQAAYHIQRDLLEAGHWELADRWLTARYIQHNPNAASGRDGVVAFFTRVLKDAKDPTKTYTTSSFDMWRFVDGKADEHWDGATKGPGA
jgi:predicted SnoaL-like aldol condensation-catalyzing enzyme